MIEKKGLEQKRATLLVLSLTLIGAGLLVLGLAAWVLLPNLIGASASDQKELASAVPVKVDFQAPELTLQDLQGNAVSLAGLHGGYVLVNHWATWCPPCKAEMPTLLEYYEDNRHQGFTIVAIDAGESAEVVQDYVQRNGLTFPVWVDPEQKGMDAFRENYLPSSYLIDPNGQVVLYWGGAISREMLDQFVTPLLEKSNGS